MEETPNNSNQTTSSTVGNTYMPALTGIRFFAVYHIFMFHMAATYWSLRQDDVATVLSSFDNAPEWTVKLAINGWMSTPLFFLLSGFILAYLYWGKDGEISTRPRRFWLLRAARIWPIHVIVLVLIAPIMINKNLMEGVSVELMIASAVATVALVQSWLPPLIPLWSWPTWTISVLAFLYLITPWLMRTLGRLNRKQMIIALCAMPFISLIPTGFYAWHLWSGGEWSMSIDMVVANNPVFWIPYYAAGMLMTRLFSISRSNPPVQQPGWFSWGDLALVGILVLAATQWIDQPMKFALRQGLLMPLFILIVLDLARGRGLFAKLFSLPGTGFLGETGYSIFIWQAVILSFVGVTSIYAPWIVPHQLWISMVMIIVLAIGSTYLIEKPLANTLRRRYIDTPSD